ncbi:sensor histidine kinase [Niabella sp. 22666]|uniref:sensor histidine kinase n=1 Tax=Niabella sp. 22666 TaxID=3453954 RepID=UPI003F87FFBC
MQPIPYRNIVIIALITIPLFGLSAAVPMPLLFSGRFTWGEARFGFLTVLLNVLSFWSINILLLYIFSRYVNKPYQWLRYVASIILCGLLAFLLMDAIRSLHIAPMGGWRQPLQPIADNLRFKEMSPSMSPPGGQRQIFHLFRLAPGQSTNVIILILLEVILLRSRKNMIEKENDHLRMANLEAQHSLLKQQLQPHFLFNSLTIVKALIKKDTQKADRYVDMLSELLRYSVYSHNNYTVTLEEELSYARTYLEMQQIRFLNSFTFSFDIPPHLLKGMIPIHSLQLLVENALKHNLFTETRPLYLKVTGDASSRTIFTENNLQRKNSVGSTTGLGLKNLADRYQLLGGETLNITQTDEKFIVSLKLLDHEDSNN